MTDLQHWARSSAGAIVIIALAAYLEVQGDACFQFGLYRASGSRKWLWLLLGTVVLAAYSLLLNASTMDFGKLLGLYVVLFFLVAQIVAKLQLGQSPTKATYVAGICFAAGGLIQLFWK